MTDNFSGAVVGLESPACNAFAVTASDSVPLNFNGSNGVFYGVTRALYIGSAQASLQVTMKDAINNTPTVFTNVPAGTLLSLRVSQVWNSNTSTGGIVAIY